MQGVFPVKSTTIPPLRVSPALRREAESVLAEGETLSSFLLDALQKGIAQRRDQRAFIARGLTSGARARRTGRYVSAEDVIKKLRTKRAQVRARILDK